MIFFCVYFIKERKKKIKSICALNSWLETNYQKRFSSRDWNGYFRRDRVFAVATAFVTSLWNLLPEMRKRDKSYVRKIRKHLIGKTCNERKWTLTLPRLPPRCCKRQNGKKSSLVRVEHNVLSGRLNGVINGVSRKIYEGIAFKS